MYAYVYIMNYICVLHFCELLIKTTLTVFPPTFYPASAALSVFRVASQNIHQSTEDTSDHLPMELKGWRIKELQLVFARVTGVVPIVV